MHALPTPQSRDRMYVMFWKKGNKSPNLDLCPKAYCSCCGQEVEAIQSWKNPKRNLGNIANSIFTDVRDVLMRLNHIIYSAFNVIDWSKPGERIGDRKKPLAANTMKRIEWGLKRCSDSSFVIYTDNSSILNRASGISDPMYTQTTRKLQHW